MCSIFDFDFDGRNITLKRLKIGHFTIYIRLDIELRIIDYLTVHSITKITIS
jgi:hypothetical protein